MDLHVEVKKTTFSLAHRFQPCKKRDVFGGDPDSRVLPFTSLYIRFLLLSAALEEIEGINFTDKF